MSVDRAWSAFQRFVENKGVIANVFHGADDIPPDMEDMNDYTVTLHYKNRKLVTPFFTGKGWKEDPTAADVLSSLISDAETVEHATTFEEWANELGYDIDSRKAEQTYKLVKRSAAKTKSFLRNEFEEFAEAARDY